MKRLCDVCDKELDKDYPHDVCESCCQTLREALADPPVRILEAKSAPVEGER